MIDCCELLIAEHRRTEDQMAGLGVLLRQMVTNEVLTESDLRAAQVFYATLAEDLRRHFALEEKALFPVLSQYRTMMLMEVEHEDLLVLQAGFAQQLERMTLGQTEDIEELELLLARFEVFKERLLAHMVEEERGIFPLANERLESEEKLKVLRLTNELIEASNPEVYDLVRPEPGFILKRANLTEPSQRPMEYQTLFEREHSTIQTLRLKAGQKQAFHWVGQTQVMVVLSGELRFEAQCRDGENEARKAQALSVGDTLTVDSRLLFSLSAVTEALLIIVKLWPHPHYTKA